MPSCRNRAISLQQQYAVMASATTFPTGFGLKGLGLKTWDFRQASQAQSARLPAEATWQRMCEPARSDARGAVDDSVMNDLRRTDEEIIRQLNRLSAGDDDYWTFRGRAVRRQTHGLTQYPAMMVPALQAELMGVVADADGGVTTVLDPFAGSGTTLVECMRLGMSFAGQDINPLAVLFCRTKAGPFRTDGLERAVRAVVERAGADRGEHRRVGLPRAGEMVLSQGHHRAFSHPPRYPES